MIRNFLGKAICQLLPLCLVGLTGCNSLKVEGLEANIKTQLEEQGNLQIKSVTCPKNVSQTGVSFQCEGLIEPEKKFLVQVEQKNPGQTSWQVPHSKGILNLALLETELQTEIAKDTKAKPAVRCSRDRYRENRPGDSFDCQVKSAALAKAKGIVEKVTVTIDAEGNVSWQQIRRTQPTAAAATPAASATAPAQAAVRQADQSAQSADRPKQKVTNSMD